MFNNYGYFSNVNFRHQPYPDFQGARFGGYPHPNHMPMLPYIRQQPTKGQATWTDGGQVTQCGIPWSTNEYMTAAVGTNTPYQCGQILKIRNLDSPTQREILVKVVDQVPNYPATKINLHRRAFTALGADPSVGVININIVSSPEVEEEEWGKYLLEVTQAAYPGYRVTDYRFIESTNMSPTQTKRTYEFNLHNAQGMLKVRGNVIYNPTTKRVISFDIFEV